MVNPVEMCHHAYNILPTIFLVPALLSRQRPPVMGRDRHRMCTGGLHLLDNRGKKNETWTTERFADHRLRGQQLFRSAVRVGCNEASYRAWVLADQAPGHVAVMQGLLWRSIGLDLEIALTIAAHGFCVGLIGAALRLGLIGHVEGQRFLASLHDLIAEVLKSPRPSLDKISTFGPACDIAFMRHEVQPGRLFAN